MADYRGESQRRVIDCHKSRILGAASHAARNDDGTGLSLQKLPVILFVAEKTYIPRSGRIERRHACIRRIEPAPDDVSIDPTGELGKREGDCQLGEVAGDYSVGATGISGFASPSVGNESAGASLLRSFRSPAVMSVASLV